MVLSSEAEIMAQTGPILSNDDEDAEIDPDILSLSLEDAKAVAEGQVYTIENV